MLIFHLFLNCYVQVSNSAVILLGVNVSFFQEKANWDFFGVVWLKSQNQAKQKINIQEKFLKETIIFSSFCEPKKYLEGLQIRHFKVNFKSKSKT